MEEEKVKKIVREGYAKVAKREGSCCGQGISEKLGYSEKELRSIPAGADLSLGCGNPVALASLKSGETVLDLGSGAGMDCFLAAKKVGAKGRVIGVDMTPEMIDRARTNLRKGNYKNVEFRLGEIENLPVADGAVDVVISNCVINLSPDKPRVFKEAFRVLKPGGRLMVSDIVLLKSLPEAIKRSVKAYVGCLAGAILKDKYIEAIETAGFDGVEVVEETQFPLDLMINDPTAKAVMKEANIRSADLKGIENTVASVKVSAIKPKA
ncbi:MAG TPA: arsenite methyltransferase [Candidatus Krumholzibacteriaceae bacterium]|jgi:ubiquinone/menaquinone biosynthesis C-methylase UbiE|nr:arsenite methyltransferase [Candidatus Krumholzibacteriaceae bacterium]